MEEKKKRVRPTVAQVKTLEKEVEKLYVVLTKRDETIRELKGKNATLEMSNTHLDDELRRQREITETLSNRVTKSDAELRRIKSRGFWARVFNK